MNHNPIEQSNNEKHEEGALLPDAPPSRADEPARRRRGFAAMAPELVKAISRKGGIAAHAAGTAHEFTTEEARVAGRKGGHASHAKRRERLHDA